MNTPNERSESGPMTRSTFSVMIPSWFYSPAELRQIKARIESAISTTTPTETEVICLNSISIEIAYRESEEYKLAFMAVDSLTQEPKS